MRKIGFLAILVILAALFAGCAEADETPPVISGVSASDITETSAVITWTTDEKATSQVAYDTESHTDFADYQWKSTLDTILVKSHSVSLTGLTENTTYHYRVKSKDDSDNLATSGDKTFTTLAAADTTPPTVASTVPTANATDVAITTTVTATFSEDMASATIDATSFLLTTDGVAVNGTVSYDVATKTATFTPSANLEAETTYMANITTAVTDLAGNPLAEDYVWSFTTAGGGT